MARMARGSLRFDMAVIGAGFTGLACARRLAEAFGLLPCLPGGATLRKTRDNRLLIRQTFAYTPRGKPTRADYGRFLEQARETIAWRWPELAPLPFDHVWSGVMCLTRNHAQLFGQIGANLYVAAFCNGAGNTSGTMAGKLVAELIPRSADNDP